MAKMNHDSNVQLLLLAGILAIWLDLAFSDEIIRPANKQIKQIGTLYDARTESFLSRGVFVRNLLNDEIGFDMDVSMNTTVSAHTRTKSHENSFNVGGELGLSIMAGMVEGSIGGRYRNVKSTNTNSITGRAVVKITTIKRSINLCDSYTMGLLDPAAFNISSTHILSGIGYGANMEIDVIDENNDNERVEDIEGQLHASITKFASLVQGSITGNAAIINSSVTSNRRLIIEVVGDIAFQANGVPMTEQDLLTFMKNIHLQIDATKKKYGRPITFYLTRIDSEIAKCVKKGSSNILEMNNIEDSLMRKVSRTFMKIRDLEEKATMLATAVSDVQHCLKEADADKVSDAKDKFDTQVSKYRYKLKEAIVSTRSGTSSTVLQSVNSNLLTEVKSRKLWQSSRSAYRPIEATVKKLQFFASHGIACPSNTQSIEDTIYFSMDKTMLMLLYNKHVIKHYTDTFIKNSNTMIQYCGPAGTVCFAIDCDGREDNCAGYQTNTVNLYIRGTMTSDSYPEGTEQNETASSNGTSTMFADISDRQQQLQVQVTTLDRLINNMYKDQRSMKSLVQTMEQQLNYTYMYQKLVFEHVLDDIVGQEARRKFKNQSLDAFTGMGGLKLEEFCRPTDYYYTVQKMEACGDGTRWARFLV